MIIRGIIIFLKQKFQTAINSLIRFIVIKRMTYPLQITLFCAIIALLIRSSFTGSCSYNPNCYQKCYNKQCQYDPSRNSFYNSSITDRSTGYHGPGCCACNAPYYWDHIYDPVTKDCVQRSCGLDASRNQTFWINNKTGYCGRNCPYWAPRRNYDTGRCQYVCSNGYFIEWMIDQCVKTCSNVTWGYKSESGNYCYSYCISPYFSNNYTRMCELQCSGDYFGLQWTRQCLLQCPYLDFKHYPTKTCVQNCPDGYYKSRATNSCVTNCYTEGQKRFYNSETGRCETFCPYGTNGDTITGFCLTSNGKCPSGLFKLDSAHKCVKNCSVAAPSSSTPDAVYADWISMQCVNQNGCSFDFSSNAQTYSDNSSMSCVRFCGNFSFQHPESKTCTQMCYGNHPNGYYHSDGNRTCLSQDISKVVYKEDNNYVTKTTFIVFGVLTIALIIAAIVGGIIFYRRKIRSKPFDLLPQQPEVINNIVNSSTFIH